MKDLLKATDKEILAEAMRLREGYKMKRVLRYNTTRDLSVHNESDAEHVFALIFLAQYFLRAEPGALSLNAERVYTILLFHDFGEITYGDIVTYEKTKAHEEREKGAAKEIFASLPETLQDMGLSAWEEYEGRSSPEARMAYALDKIEPLFELLDAVNEQSMKRLKITYEMHIEHKMKAVEGYPLLTRFTEVISNDMRSRDIFWKE